MISLGIVVSSSWSIVDYIELIKDGERIPLDFNYSFSKKTDDHEILYMEIVNVVPYIDSDKIGEENLHMEDLLRGMDSTELTDNIIVGLDDGSGKTIELNPMIVYLISDDNIRKQYNKE